MGNFINVVFSIISPQLVKITQPWQLHITSSPLSSNALLRHFQHLWWLSLYPLHRCDCLWQLFQLDLEVGGKLRVICPFRFITFCLIVFHESSSYILLFTGAIKFATRRRICVGVVVLVLLGSFDPVRSVGSSLVGSSLVAVFVAV